MYVIIWEYRVKIGRRADFERVYSAEGPWSTLFSKAEGYTGTELLRHPDDPQRYITIDRWVSPQAYESFLSRWKEEYAELDRQCTELTEREFHSGQWESVSSETR